MRDLFIILAFLSFSCSNSSENKQELAEPPVSMLKPDPNDSWETNHGIGPVNAFEFENGIDSVLVSSGKVIFDQKCLVCHQMDNEVIGPSMKEIYKRRTVAWTMNMILNPEEMITRDPIGKQLFEDYGTIMVYQDISMEEARAMAEYFRTL